MPIKTMNNLTSRAFSKLKKDPNLLNQKMQTIINQVFQDVWADYYKEPITQKRLEIYKASMLPSQLKRLNKSENPAMLRRDIEKLFRDKANQVSK